MQLDTIIRIENFIVDALNNSPQIPLSVQILRLADSIENEGVVNQANTIVIRYSNSYTQDKNREPVVSERVITFQLDYICQSYLSSTGQDFALTLLNAVYNILKGVRPPNSSADVIEGFRLSRESFEGITENSQYAYVQEWELILEDVSSELILDPCVARGNCSQKWPPDNIDTPINPWEVVYDGKIWGPNCPDSSIVNPSCGAEINQIGDWVYLCDQSIFIPAQDTTDVIFQSTGALTSEGLLCVRAFRISTGELYGEYVFCCTGRKVSQIIFDLYRSPIGLVGVQEVSSREFLFRQQGLTSTQTGIINQNTIAVSDPTNPDSLAKSILFGSRVNIFIGTTLTVNEVTWILTNIPGVPWIPLDRVTLIEIQNSSCPDNGLNCT